MKALSVKQPWAWQIIHGGKDVENRDWDLFKPNLGLPKNYSLPVTIAVHSSKAMTQDDYADYWYFAKNVTTNIASKHNLVFGAILGTVEITDCTIDPNISKWCCGYYGFVLRNPRPLITPIPCKGALGFWDVPTELEQQILEELG